MGNEETTEDIMARRNELVKRWDKIDKRYNGMVAALTKTYDTKVREIIDELTQIDQEINANNLSNNSRGK